MYFVTGTDTDAGKTCITAGLLRAAGSKSLGLKPIAAGCELTAAGLRNSDALQLMQASGIKLSYEQVNPIAFEEAIAPHIAAKRSQHPLTVEQLTPLLPQAAMKEASLCLVEGAGGWRLPLNYQQTLPQWVQQQAWPVILVVGVKLGCLNHALLTAAAIQQDGLELIGWVANQVDPSMSAYQDNLDTLKSMMPVPMLASVPFLAEPETAADHLQQAAVRLLKV
ncbi:dethiobiotin synthase [Ferrimonas lipolytica]|uniref:ATP-dependent dethiobiotin synthetase BioD n=1 Tax=Ferrimonas lipolytica TaxID=2724191 RepID=A0A6H1ULY0_9GAMM|nr:dethiobiotin synthase [Ferrimonas lipolytica]QIZ78802.1 dethiobiotin synthase [Ferrimonas lipolytica]